MRMLPSRYTQGGAPLQFKKKISQIKHLQAPLKGLSLTSKLVAGDPRFLPDHSGGRGVFGYGYGHCPASLNRSNCPSICGSAFGAG